METELKSLIRERHKSGQKDNRTMKGGTMDDLDLKYNDAPTCTYCGAELFVDKSGDGDETVVDGDKCEKKYTVRLEITVQYSTQKEKG